MKSETTEQSSDNSKIHLEDMSHISNPSYKHDNTQFTSMILNQYRQNKTSMGYRNPSNNK